ncbi:MAG: endonuclease/exonuclease/phosphatase family protein [Prevotella sp.]|nr:endonuclease/exonuclease/phosphatase family protein [Prevotella sp.]
MKKFSVSLSFVISYFLFIISHFIFSPASAQSLTLVELNGENLFDTRHDEGKDDEEFTPNGMRHWSPARYWRKLNHTAQTILACSEDLPDLVALVEVENDSVLHDLTRRSLLRNAGYHYLMTCSADERGVDVALLYQPSSFRPICYEEIVVPLVQDMRPTRDILYVQGEVITGDTLHVFVLHSPSRFHGEYETRPFRMQAARTLTKAVDSIFAYSPGAMIVAAGDFNDQLTDPSLRHVVEHGLVSATTAARGTHGSPSNYRFQDFWQQIDHVFCSPRLFAVRMAAYVNDAPFLLEEDIKYGGQKPRRTFVGYHYQQGFSDHLPLVVRFALDRLVPTGSSRAVPGTR